MVACSKILPRIPVTRQRYLRMTLDEFLLSQSSVGPQALACRFCVREPKSFHAPAASNAFAGAIEGYVFQGSGPENFQLHVTLTGTVTGNANISGMAGVLDTESFTFDVSNAFEFTSIGDTIASMFIDGNSPGTKSTVINFTLSPGQEFYIAANLSASASGVGGEASSLNTLTTSISGSAAGLAGLTSSSVPEPAAMTSLLLIACILGGRRWASIVLKGC